MDGRVRPGEAGARFFVGPNIPPPLPSAPPQSGKDLGQDVGARLARWSQFLIAGQRACAAAVPAADPSGGTHLGSLVHHALAALEASEKLAVGPSAPAPPPASSSWARLARSALGRGGGGSTADQGALAAGLETLSTPLNLRLCRAPGAEGAGVRDHGASVVSVVPMVTLDQVEDFLWLRVRDERSAPASREVGARSPPGAGTRSGGAGAGAPGGRLTRAQARAAAEAALAAPGAGARGEGEEGGDLDWLTAGMEAAAGEGSGEWWGRWSSGAGSLCWACVCTQCADHSLLGLELVMEGGSGWKPRERGRRSSHGGLPDPAVRTPSHPHPIGALTAQGRRGRAWRMT